MDNYSLEQIKDVSYIIDTNLNYYHKQMGYPLENLDTNKNELNKKFKSGISFGLYLKDNENTIGYIQYELYDSDDLFRKSDTAIAITDLYIDEKYRGLKLSNLLLNQNIVINYLKEKLPLKNYGLFAFIDLENEKSMKLHLESNFKIYKEELDMYGQDNHAYVLYKSFDNNNLYKDILFDDFKILDKYSNIKDKEFNNTHNINTNIDFKINIFEQTKFKERFEKLYEKLEYSPIKKKLSFININKNNNDETFNKNIDKSLKKMIDYANDCKIDLQANVYNDKGRLVLNLDNQEQTFYPFLDKEYLKEIINDFYEIENNEINFI